MSLRFEKNTGRIELDKLVNGQALKLGVSGVTIAGSDRDPPSSSSINTTTASNPALNTTQSNPNLLFGSQPPPPSTSMKKKGGGSTANMLTTPTDHNNSASIITPPITKVLVGDAWESRQVSSLKFVQAAWRIMFSNRVNKWIKSMKAYHHSNKEDLKLTKRQSKIMIDDRHHDFNSPATIAKTTAAVPYTQSHSFQPSDHLLRKRLDLGRMNELLSQVAAEPSPKQSEFVSRPAQQTLNEIFHMLSASKTGNPINIEKSKIAAATHDQNLFVNSSPSSSVTSSSNGIPIVINPATDETKTESDDNLISIQEQQHQPQNSSQPHLTSYAMPENEFPFEYAFKTMNVIQSAPHFQRKESSFQKKIFEIDFFADHLFTHKPSRNAEDFQVLDKINNRSLQTCLHHSLGLWELSKAWTEQIPR